MNKQVIPILLPATSELELQESTMQPRFPTRVSRLILHPVLPPPTWSAAHPSLLLNLPCQSSCCCSPVYPYSTLHPCPGCSCLSRFVLPDLFTFSTYSSSTLYKQPCSARSSPHPTQHCTPAVSVLPVFSWLPCSLSAPASFTRGCRLTPHFLPSLHILTSITTSHEQSVYIIPGFFCSQSVKLNCITPKFVWELLLGNTKAIGSLSCGHYQFRPLLLAVIQDYRTSSSRSCVCSFSEHSRKASASTPIVQCSRRTRKARDLGSLYSWHPHPD